MATEFTVQSGGVTLSGEESGDGAPGAAAARAHRHSPLRGDGLKGARALRAPRDPVRRASARPLVAGADAGGLHLRPARRRRAGRARRPWRRAGGAGRRLDGGAHAAERRPAPSRAGRGHRRDHARLQRRRRSGGARGWRAGTASPRACAPGASMAFVEAYGIPQTGLARVRQDRRGPSRASGSRSTITRMRWPTRCEALPRSAPFGSLEQLAAISRAGRGRRLRR